MRHIDILIIYMPETENQEAKLQNFRQEIMELKDRNFPGLFAIEDINDLGMEESGVWNEFKMFFKEVYTELSKLDMKQKDVLDKLLAELSGIAEINTKNTSITKNTNSLEFFAWINNRLGILSLSLQRIKHQKASENDLRRVMETISGEKKNLHL